MRAPSRPVFQGGELGGMVRDYSDTLMIFTLKDRRPHAGAEPRAEQI